MDVWILVLSAVTGWIAAIIGIVTVIPQCFLLNKTKDSASISTWMYILFFVGCIIWTIWAFGYLFQILAQHASEIADNKPESMSLAMIYIINIPILMLNINGVLVSGYVLINKFINIFGARKMNITERKYGQLRLKKAQAKKQKKANGYYLIKNTSHDNKKSDPIKEVISLQKENHKLKKRVLGK